MFERAQHVQRTIPKQPLRLGSGRSQRWLVDLTDGGKARLDRGFVGRVDLLG